MPTSSTRASAMDQDAVELVISIVEDCVMRLRMIMPSADVSKTLLEFGVCGALLHASEADVRASFEATLESYRRAARRGA